ncbi:MAG: NnrU family protein [Pseudomonadota bacterium]
MGQLVAGIGLFFFAHALPLIGTLRARLVQAFGGEQRYLLGFALASLIGMILMARGYGAMDYVALWDPPRWTRAVAFVLMLPVFSLMIAAYLPGTLRKAIPHPMLLGVKLWALAHLIANGDLGSLLLFGSFLAYGVIDLISVKRRHRAAGRTPTIGPVRNDIIALVAGLAIYGVTMVWGHAAIIGVALVG